MNLSFIFEIDSDYRKPISAYKLRFTSSINIQTSTLIANFYTPNWLVNSIVFFQKKQQVKIVLKIDNQGQFLTTDIKFLWIRGKPSIIQAVFLITSENQSIKLKQLFEHLNEKNRKFN